MSDGLRGSTQYNYDPAGQLTRRVNTMDRQVEEFAWDGAGNLLDDAQRSNRGTSKAIACSCGKISVSSTIRLAI
jgi:uncharacterized protein RhaS with RHS repeats